MPCQRFHHCLCTLPCTASKGRQLWTPQLATVTTRTILATRPCRTANFYGGNGIVGAQIPLGAGIAMAHKYSGGKYSGEK